MLSCGSGAKCTEVSVTRCDNPSVIPGVIPKLHGNNAKAGTAAHSTTANTAKQRTGMLCARQVIVLCVAVQ